MTSYVDVQSAIDEVKKIVKNILIQANTQLTNSEIQEIVDSDPEGLLQAFVSETSPFKQIIGNSYERDEYVGDSILKHVVALITYRMFPQDGPQQLTEINAYMNSAPQQSLIFDKMRLGGLYSMLEDPGLMRLRRNRIPVGTKSDVLEALVYGIYNAVNNVIQGSGEYVCFNIILAYRPEAVSPYRKNGGWRAMLNQSIGKSEGGVKGEDSRERYPVRVMHKGSGTYVGTIKLERWAIDDISAYAHNDEFLNVRPLSSKDANGVRRDYVEMTGESRDIVEDSLYQYLFLYIVNVVGYQWLQNYRRYRNMIKLFGPNTEEGKYFIDNYVFPSAQIHSKSSGDGVTVVITEYNQFATESPPGPPISLDEIKQDVLDNNPEITDPNGKEAWALISEKDSIPSLGRYTYPVWFGTQSGNDSSVRRKALEDLYKFLSGRR